jgi:hypothetical protein
MPIFDAVQKLFVGDLVKEKRPSPSEKGNRTWIVIETEKAGSFVKLNKNHHGWIFNDDLVLISRTNKLKERA